MNTDQTDQTDPREEEQEIAPAATPGGASPPRSRRHLLTLALGGAGTLALAASGTLALRRAAAQDDDDESDDDDHSGGDHGDDDSSGSGGDDDSDSGSSDDSDDDSDSDSDDDDDSGQGRGRGRGGDDDDDEDDEDEDDGAITAGTPTAGVTEVRITDDDADAFSPQSITVELGAEVTFFNDDDKDHTATGAGFDTGVLAPGESATVTLDEPGEQFYSCLIHPEMTGTIVVRDASGGATGATPGATPRVIEGSAGSAGSAGAGGGETVTISDFAFEPDALTVAVGTTVTWENADAAPHTATAEDGAFDTDRIDTGGSAAVTFDEAGTFAYVCLFHPNMQATITVE